MFPQFRAACIARMLGNEGMPTDAPMTRQTRNSRPAQQPAPEDDEDTCRLDKWLWVARFYKTRSLATEAIDAGHVRLNGARSKPARALKSGDRINIVKGDEHFEITVHALSNRRGSAQIAATLFVESPESVAARAQRQGPESATTRSPRPAAKPSKRDRRNLQRFLAGG